jgi:hypothetical protein
MYLDPDAALAYYDALAYSSSIVSSIAQAGRIKNPWHIDVPYDRAPKPPSFESLQIWANCSQQYLTGIHSRVWQSARIDTDTPSTSTPSAARSEGLKRSSSPTKSPQKVFIAVRTGRLVQLSKAAANKGSIGWMMVGRDWLVGCACTVLKVMYITLDKCSNQ